MTTGLGRAQSGAVALVFLVMLLAVFAPAAVFFWPDYNRSVATPVVDSEITGMLNEIRTAQQKTTNDMKAINDSLAASRADLRMLLDRFSVLTARVDALQSKREQALHDSAELGDRFAVIRAPINQDKLAVAGPLNSLTQMAREPTSDGEQPIESQQQTVADIAKASQENPQAKVPLPAPRPRWMPKRKLATPAAPPNNPRVLPARL